MPLYPADPAEHAAVVSLVNAAYRGHGARRGWTTEADYIDGQRIDIDTLRADLEAHPGAELLLLRDGPDSELLGCVWLEPHDQDVWHVGMVTVRPDLQDRGLGRRLLEGAEQVAREAGGRRLRMTVIHLRDSLIAWYQRRGYRLTGESEPFPYGDLRFGAPRRDDLRFLVMEKAL